MQSAHGADDGFIHDINQHSFVVMRPAAAGDASVSSEDLREHSPGLEDLRKPEEPGFEPLHIAHHRASFSKGAAPLRPAASEQPADARQALADLASLSLVGAHVDPAAAEKVLRELTWHHGVDDLNGWGAAGGEGAQNPAEVLGSDLLAVLRQVRRMLAPH